MRGTVNRYRGSGGMPERVPTPQPQPRPRPNSPLPPQQERKPPKTPPGHQRPPPGGKPPQDSPPGKKKAPEEHRRGLEHILARLDPGKLETEDLLVFAILWLLYRDSGDKDLLIAMGAYLFL